MLIYDASFVRECMVYLLASMLATDEDRDLANVYADMYAKLEKKYLTVFFEDMDDHYKEASS